MKLTHKLCGAALLALVGVAMALPAATKADGPESHSSTGKVRFTVDTSDSDTVTPPETDGPEITEPTGNPASGELKVIAISPLDFGTNKVKAASKGGWEYYAKTFTTTEKGNPSNKIEMPNFMTFKDVRADDLPNTYKVTAKATPFKVADSGKTLNGATISYGNIRLTTLGGADKLNPSAAATAQVLQTDGSATEFVNQNDTTEGKGFGRFDLVFGKLEDSTADKSVKLWIPAADNKLSTKGEYVSTITWTIASAR